MSDKNSDNIFFVWMFWAMVVVMNIVTCQHGRNADARMDACIAAEGSYVWCKEWSR